MDEEESYSHLIRSHLKIIETEDDKQKIRQSFISISNTMKQKSQFFNPTGPFHGQVLYLIRLINKFYKKNEKDFQFYSGLVFLSNLVLWLDKSYCLVILQQNPNLLHQLADYFLNDKKEKDLMGQYSLLALIAQLMLFCQRSPATEAQRLLQRPGAPHNPNPNNNNQGRANQVNQNRNNPNNNVPVLENENIRNDIIIIDQPAAINNNERNEILNSSTGNNNGNSLISDPEKLLQIRTSFLTKGFLIRLFQFDLNEVQDTKRRYELNRVLSLIVSMVCKNQNILKKEKLQTRARAFILEILSQMDDPRIHFNYLVSLHSLIPDTGFNEQEVVRHQFVQRLVSWLSRDMYTTASGLCVYSLRFIKQLWNDHRQLRPCFLQNGLVLQLLSLFDLNPRAVHHIMIEIYKTEGVPLLRRYPNILSVIMDTLKKFDDRIENFKIQQQQLKMKSQISQKQNQQDFQPQQQLNSQNAEINQQPQVHIGEGINPNIIQNINILGGNNPHPNNNNNSSSTSNIIKPLSTSQKEELQAAIKLLKEFLTGISQMETFRLLGQGMLDLLCYYLTKGDFRIQELILEIIKFLLDTHSPSMISATPFERLSTSGLQPFTPNDSNNNNNTNIPNVQTSSNLMGKPHQQQLQFQMQQQQAIMMKSKNMSCYGVLGSDSSPEMESFCMKKLNVEYQFNQQSNPLHLNNNNLNNFNNINHNNVVNSFFELNNTGKFTVKPVVSQNVILAQLDSLQFQQFLLKSLLIIQPQSFKLHILSSYLYKNYYLNPMIGIDGQQEFNLNF